MGRAMALWQCSGRGRELSGAPPPLLLPARHRAGPQRPFPGHGAPGSHAPRSLNTSEAAAVAGGSPQAAEPTPSLTPTGFQDSGDAGFMRLALEQAALACAADEVPVGAVLVSAAGEVLAAAHNQTEASSDPTAHAELLCVRQAATSLGGWRLLDATLYVTLEPCPMCAGALLQVSGLAVDGCMAAEVDCCCCRQ
jgi:pyrimidine deaminase RibD-like protein